MTIDYNPGEDLPSVGNTVILDGSMNTKTANTNKSEGKEEGKGLSALTRPWGSRECFCGAERCRGWV